MGCGENGLMDTRRHWIAFAVFVPLGMLAFVGAACLWGLR